MLPGFRYVRLACSCLGPRGDDKNGCQDSWQAFCMMSDRKSCISSFRSNGFNNIFQASAALHYHREDISNCLQCLSNLNLKLQSITEDCKCDETNCQLVALGLLYYRLTEPCWSLLKREIHYLDFSTHIDRLYNLLTSWSEDPSNAFDEDVQP